MRPESNSEGKWRRESTDVLLWNIPHGVIALYHKQVQTWLPISKFEFSLQKKTRKNPPNAPSAPGGVGDI